MCPGRRHGTRDARGSGYSGRAWSRSFTTRSRDSRLRDVTLSTKRHTDVSTSRPPIMFAWKFGTRLTETGGIRLARPSPAEQSLPREDAAMENRDRVHSGPGSEHAMGGGWTGSETSELGQATRQHIDAAKQGAKDYASEAKDYIQGAVHQTRAHVEGTVQQARDKVTEYRDGGFEKMKDDVAWYTREQPMTALLIAAGAGLVVGWLSAASRR